MSRKDQFEAIKSSDDGSMSTIQVGSRVMNSNGQIGIITAICQCDECIKRYYHSIGLASEKEASGHIHWNKGGIYTILKNRVYCGDMVQGKYRTKSYVQTARPKSDWIIVEDTHEAIVNKELFDKVQRRWPKSDDTKASRKKVLPLISSASKLPNSKKSNTSENIFLRKIFCGHCGFTMRRARSGKVKHQFKCETKHYYGKNDCVTVSISEDKLKEVLLFELNKQAIALGGVQALGVLTPQENKAEKSELMKLQSEIDRNSRFLQGLYESLSQGDITSDEYRTMKANYESKISQLKEKETELRSEMLNRAVKNAEDSKTISKLHAVQQLTDLTADNIDRLIKRIDVFEDKRIEIHFAFTEKGQT